MPLFDSLQPEFLGYSKIAVFVGNFAPPVLNAVIAVVFATP